MNDSQTEFTAAVDAWAAAERTGDLAALAGLLHPDFVAVGPFGFVLDREQWMARYASGDLRNASFSFAPDVPTRTVGEVAIVVGTQQQEGTHQGRPIDGAFRVTLVLCGGPAWRVVGAHLSLRHPPTTGSDAS